jgi:hypothetical protein
MHLATANIRFPTHHVSIKVDPDTRRIYVFKYSNQQCDFDVFDDQYQASEYVLTAPQPQLYRVTFPGE